MHQNKEKGYTFFFIFSFTTANFSIKKIKPLLLKDDLKFSHKNFSFYLSHFYQTIKHMVWVSRLTFSYYNSVKC